MQQKQLTCLNVKVKVQMVPKLRDKTISAVEFNKEKKVKYS